jgi:hypothetical protein
VEDADPSLSDLRAHDPARLAGTIRRKTDGNGRQMRSAVTESPPTFETKFRPIPGRGVRMLESDQGNLAKSHRSGLRMSRIVSPVRSRTRATDSSKGTREQGNKGGMTQITDHDPERGYSIVGVFERND